LPAEWAELGITADEWANLGETRKRRRGFRAACATAIAAAAAAFDNAVRNANNVCATACAQIANPLVLVFEAGYDQLPLVDQVAIESLTGEDRQVAMDARIRQMRAAAIARVRAGQPPF